MQCVKPILLRDKKTLRKFPEGLLVPCGKCCACRIAYRRLWTIRMFHELHYHENSIFLTLTYDDEHLPPNNSLVKEDLQKFFKRLRRRLGEKKIKYFACGEYGSRTSRPHYHAIIFGLSLGRDDKFTIIDSWPYCDWNQESIFRNSFGLAEADSIAYVAGYINKKFSGDEAIKEYVDKNIQPVFRLMSNGLGKDYVDEFSDDLKRTQSIMYRGKEMSLPRYYFNRLELDTSELQDKAKSLDCDFVEDTTGVYISSDDLYHLSDTTMMRSLIGRKDRVNKQRSLNIEAKLQLVKSKL